MERCCIQAFHTNFNQSVLLEIAQAMVDTVRESACCAACCSCARRFVDRCARLAAAVYNVMRVWGAGLGWVAESVGDLVCRACATQATFT